ncbi:multimerin-2 [Ochotona princeps]|uniref:multimerin-2 n=1 Tax=Ochotona princeps TaxID=9978 RepID=UPI002714D289|nr:multimerin-2 [Ochotona princeps]
MNLILLFCLGGLLGWAQVLDTSVSEPWRLRPPGTRAEDLDPDPARRNWCPYQKSRLVTYVAACKTEKFLVHSQQPCPQGEPDCQTPKVMDRMAPKLVYQVKQKVLMSVDWRCCPGFGGPDCQYYGRASRSPYSKANIWYFPLQTPPQSQNLQGLAAVASLILRAGWAARSTEQQGQQQPPQGGFQNDMQPGLDDLTVTGMEANHTELGAGCSCEPGRLAGFPGRALEQVLLHHADTFLQQHLGSIWKNFNDSLHSLSQAVRNLSLDVAANRQAIQKVQEDVVARADVQELGAKFEVKVQENAQRVRQLQQAVEEHLYAQLQSLRHSLSEFQTDVDARLKWLHKAQESRGSHGGLEAAAKPEPDSLHARLGQLQRNLSELHAALGRREEELQGTLGDMSATLAQHSEEIKELYSESDETFDQISRVERQVEELQVNHTALRELRIILMEKSLIMEENKEELEQQLMELNVTLQQLQGGQADLLKYAKDCNCQRLYLDLDVIREDQKGTTRALEEAQLSLDEQRRLDSSSLQALSSAVDAVAQAMDARKAEGEQARADRARLRSQLQAVHGEVGALQAAAGPLRAEVQRLHSAFAALLQDALRHEAVLAALFGEDALERLTEDEANPLPLRYEHIRTGLQDAASGLQEQALAWHALAAQVATLEQLVKQRLEPPQDTLPEEAGAATLAQLQGLMTEVMSQVNSLQHCCEAPGAAPFNSSLQGLSSVLSATQHDLQQHRQLFHRLFDNFQELLDTNVSLDLSKLQALVSRKERKQQKGLDGSRKRDKKQVQPWADAGAPVPMPRGPGGLWGTGSPVAFYASSSQGATAPQMVAFDVTSINFGGGYLPQHGYFMAPEHGIYLLVVSVEFGPGPGTGLLVPGGSGRTPVSIAKQRDDGSAATTLALLELQKGERVWLELTQGSITPGTQGTTFGGFLLFRT